MIVLDLPLFYIQIIVCMKITKCDACAEAAFYSTVALTYFITVLTLFPPSQQQTPPIHKRYLLQEADKYSFNPLKKLFLR